MHESELYKLYDNFTESYKRGNFVKAEQALLQTLKLPLNNYEECSTYCNLGSVCIVLGKFDEALKFFSKAEKLNPENADDKFLLASVFINKAIIYRNRRSYSNSREYFEKGIRLYIDLLHVSEQAEKSLASAYYNFGIYYFTIGEYQTALNYYIKSSDIKQKFNMPVYLEIISKAKAYAGMKLNDDADKHFRDGLYRLIKETSKENFRLADFYAGYANFLQSTGRFDDAYINYRKALDICKETFGEKNTNTSLSYKYLGDYFSNRSAYDSALFYYQKSLISVVEDFNNPDPYSNPQIDSSAHDIRLLDNLKGKATVFEKKAIIGSGDESKVRDMAAGLRTIELAMDLTESIKNNSPSEESQLYLAANEKETFLSAIRLSSKINDITHNKNFPFEAFAIAQRAKASMLRTQVRQNDLLYSSSTPDSLRQRQRLLSSGIAAYNKHLLDESVKASPDNEKINIWKDELFRMKREKEDVEQQIISLYPQYSNLMKRMEPVSYEEIKKITGKDETIIDYLLSNEDKGGNRQLYVFVINRQGIQFIDIKLDSLFSDHAAFIRNISDPTLSNGSFNRFNNYSSALNYMYENLFMPVEDYIKDNRIIIIPDEEIGGLPFEAFLKTPPAEGAHDFEGLDFLINKYIFSYGYSASLLSRSRVMSFRKPAIMSFSPSYEGFVMIDSLGGAMEEILAIGKLFQCKSYIRDEATRENFLHGINDPAIFHLAMHSISDTVNSLYSYLLFSNAGNDENSRLYNYEISLSRLRSPMIVLSSCNSGTGTLFSGEGVMSLARSFMLAGAFSVVRTSWEVNDETGSEIITKFYSCLSDGLKKDEAIRLAKLDFIKSSPPTFSDPYYWAAYEVLGDNSPVVNNKLRIVTFVTIISVVSCLLFIYFRRRKISAERSM